MFMSPAYCVSLAMEQGLRVRTKAPGASSTVERACGGIGVDGAGGNKDDGNVAEPEEPLSPYSRLFHSPTLDTSLIIIFGYATTVDIDVLKQRMTETLIKHPRFSSKLVFDGEKVKNPRWIRTKVNIEDHVIVPDLDPIIDKPDRFVEDYAYDVSKAPIDLSKPLWEFHVLNIKTSNANAVSVFKMHHSLGDGMSLVSLLLSCSRKTSNPEELPSVPMPKKKESGTVGGPFRYLIALWLILKLFLNTLLQTVLAFGFEDTYTPIKGRKGVDRVPKRIVHRLISLDDIKLVKNALNVTVNDVIVGLSDAALARYLHRKHGPIAAKGDHIRLRASVIANVRQTAGLQDLADMMEKGSKCSWGNKVGCFLVPFHGLLVEDPLEYVRKVSANLSQKKMMFEAAVSYSCNQFVVNTFGIKVAAALTYKLLFNSTLMVSNVPGPTEEIAFCGQRLAYVAPTGWGLPIGLIIHYMSYIDKMTIVVGACQDLIPDVHELCDDIESSLQLMKNAILQGKTK